MKIMKQKSIFQLFIIANVLVLMASFFVMSNMLAMDPEEMFPTARTFYGVDSMVVDPVEMDENDPSFVTTNIRNDTPCSIVVISRIEGFLPLSGNVLPGNDITIPIAYELEQNKWKLGSIEIIYGSEGQTYENLIEGANYSVSSMISVQLAGQ